MKKQVMRLVLYVVFGFLLASSFSAIANVYKKHDQKQLNTELLQEFNTSYLLFATSTCAYCEKARITLSHLGIEYKELLIEKNPEYEYILTKRLNEKAVPVLVMKSGRLIGFELEAYESLLSK